MENLQNKKKEIIEQIGIDGLKQLKFSKILKLLQSEIQELMNYWTIKQIHKMVNEVFEVNLSSPLLYKFARDLKKDEISKSIKSNKKLDLGVVQNRTTKKDEKSINNIDDLTDSTLDFLSKNLPKKQRIKNV